MPKICQTTKAQFSLPLKNARFELFGVLKCQLATPGNIPGATAVAAPALRNPSEVQS